MRMHTSTCAEDEYNGSCRQEQLKKLTMQGLVFKPVGVYSERSCRVAIIY